MVFRRGGLFIKVVVRWVSTVFVILHFELSGVETVVFPTETKLSAHWSISYNFRICMVTYDICMKTRTMVLNRSFQEEKKMKKKKKSFLCVLYSELCLWSETRRRIYLQYPMPIKASYNSPTTFGGKSNLNFIYHSHT